MKGSWKSGGRLGSTPIYYLPHLRKMPERSARVVKAIAEAEPGGVLVHCVSGRDRTGLMVLIVLSLIGVNISDIAED
ncbi:tyrosine-protein phosphatase, partial [Acinetobacter baumannii]